MTILFQQSHQKNKISIPNQCLLKNTGNIESRGEKETFVFKISFLAL